MAQSDPAKGYLEREYQGEAYLTEKECKLINASVNRVFGKSIGASVNLIQYNVTGLRVLCVFDNRGNDGLTWTAGSTEPGDFVANNLNTDIVEQLWKSATGTLTTTLDCDSQVTQGISPDTFALLNHNLTTGASITVQSSNSPTFATILDTFTFPIESGRSFFVVPLADFPYQLARYWRFNIADVNNADNFLSIGTIVFGSASIFAEDCMTDRIRKGQTHFKDAMPNEGFTSATNDRALKRNISMKFKNMRFGKGDYTRLVEIFELARTSLKCLWIPTPINPPPQRFATFGKLPKIPDEDHNVKGDSNEDLDFIDISVNVDEAL